VEYVSKRWSGPSSSDPGPVVCCCESQSGSEETLEKLELDQFLNLARTRSFTLSAMAFQDAWNLDIERVKDCCIHVATPDNQLVPFCLYNLTSSTGKHLYRNRENEIT
jgi:hypothetical protein